MTTTRTPLTAATAIIGTPVAKSANGALSFIIADVQTTTYDGKESLTIRVRKASASKGGLNYSLNALWT